MQGETESEVTMQSTATPENAQAHNRWLGIDFSGDCRMWRATRRKTNVWVAELSGEPDQPVLDSVRTVHELPGEEAPFYKLLAFLKRKHFAAAAIDAPFSIPLAYLPWGSQGKLLKLVAGMKRPENCPFPTANDFVRAVLAGRALQEKKPLRETERYWQKQNVNVRLTLWAGARGGAAMTSACLTLLYGAGCSIWPWARTMASGLLVEAFPAAQLCQWEMSHDRYNGNEYEASSTRRKLVDSLSARIHLGPFRGRLEASADALDAVVCGFAANAVTSRKLPNWLPDAPDPEGRIAVHK